MSRFFRRFWPVFALELFVVIHSTGAEVDDWFDRLGSPDIDVRRAAVDEIQTLDDPRIPAACLPLLDDEGNSIRRLAARAIGSRFAQIPPERVNEYVAVLRECAETTEHEGAKAMCQRAIGLLTRDYSSDQFSVSPDSHWVLYERRRLPVIADAQADVHTLLSPVMPTMKYARENEVVRNGDIVWDGSDRRSGLLKLMVTNRPVNELFDPVWHPRSEALAFSPVVQMKFYRPICLWRASDGEFTVWDVRSFLPLLPGGWPHWSSIIDFVKWDGPLAVFHIYDCDDGGGEPYDPEGVFVSVDVRDWKIDRIR